MRTPVGKWRRGFLLVATAGLLLVNSTAIAQGDSEPSPMPKTASNEEIPLDHLQVMLRPLSKSELEGELDRWIELLRAKIREVGETELKIKDLAANDPDAKLKETLVRLRTEEAAVADRARTVLEALKAKGGDVQEAEQFIGAVSSISETTDSTSRWAALVGASVVADTDAP